MRKKLLLVLLVALITDITLAQLAKVYWDLWDVRKIERNYRIHSKIYLHDLEPNVKTIGIHGKWRYRINTNSFEFKDKIVRNVPLESNGYRILFMGDSFTEGNGVDFENTFVGIVSEELSKKGVEVLNAAVASYSPSIYYRKIKYLTEDVGLDFDEVIVFIDLSDAYDEVNVYRFDEHENVVNASPSLQGYETLPENRKWHEMIGSFLKNNSVLARAESIIKAQYFDPDPPMGWGACYYRSGDEAILKDANRSVWTIDSDAYERYGQKGLEKSRQSMDKLLDLFRRKNIILKIAVYPWPDQILYNDLNSAHVTFWKNWARKNRIEIFNFSPYFIDGDNPKVIIRKFYIPCDMHWNEEGHRFTAEIFLKEFEHTISKRIGF